MADNYISMGMWLELSKPMEVVVSLLFDFLNAVGIDCCWAMLCQA